MADEADVANDRAQLELDLILQSTRSTETNTLPRGTCHYCNAPVNEVQLFCDSDCASDHEYMNRRNTMR